MGDWILNEFMKLFDNVLGWIVTSLGGLWGGLIEIFLEALIMGAKETLSDIVHAILGSLTNEVIQGIDAVAWIPEWVKYGLTTFAGNVGEALGTIADGAITMTAQGAAEILGVTNAQEIYMTNLQNSLDVQLNAMLDRITTQSSTDIAVTEETAVAFTQGVYETVRNAYISGTEFLRSSQIGIDGYMENARTAAYTTLQTALLGIQHTSRTATDMMDRGLAGAYDYLMEVSLNQAGKFLNDMRDTIIIPAANAEAMYWAFSEAMKVDEDDLAKQLEAQFVAVLRLAAKMGKDPTALELHKEPFQ